MKSDTRGAIVMKRNLACSNNCGSSCPEKGLYIILLRVMSEGRNMRFKANRVVALKRSCLMGIFSFGSQERNIVETER